MAAHAPLAASASPGWGNCSGYRAANAFAPSTPTPQSLAGDAAHWVGSSTLELIRGGRNTWAEHFLGKTDPAGTVIDDDMVEGAQIYIDDCMSLAGPQGQAAQMMIERRVGMPQIHPENWGTFDWGIIVGRKKAVHLTDYKHGHREVMPYNFQMVDYMAGIVNLLPFGFVDTEWTVSLRVVQPYSYSASGPVKEWVGMLSDLRADFNRLHHMAHESYNHPKMTAGLTQCRDCAARGTCATARKAGYALVDHAEESYEIDIMTGRELAFERSICMKGEKLLKARREAIDDNLRHRINAGELDIGLTTENTRGHQAWTVPVDQAIALAGSFGVDISKPGVKTPTQTRAAMPKEHKANFEQVLEATTERPIRGSKLIDAADSVSARAFGRK